MDKTNNNIDGVKIITKKVISDDRGKILHMLKNDDSEYQKFGEIYFSYVFVKKLRHGTYIKK